MPSSMLGVDLELRGQAPRGGEGGTPFPRPCEALGDFAQVSSLHPGDLQMIFVRFFHTYNRMCLLRASLWL